MFHCLRGSRIVLWSPLRSVAAPDHARASDLGAIKISVTYSDSDEDACVDQGWVQGRERGYMRYLILVLRATGEEEGADQV